MDIVFSMIGSIYCIDIVFDGINDDLYNYCIQYCHARQLGRAASSGEGGGIPFGWKSSRSVMPFLKRVYLIPLMFHVVILFWVVSHTQGMTIHPLHL